MPTTKIAIIGGGAKAAAICAKAACLNEINPTDDKIEVTVFEKSEIGANWTGGHGYTDGLQDICTQAERDIGFPYTHWKARYNYETDTTDYMLANYSWQAFLLAGVHESNSNDDAYAVWIDKNRPRLTHGDFAKYLKWCISKSNMETIFETVERLAPRSGKWAVTTLGSRGEKIYKGFDRVVITGPGHAKRIPNTISDPNLYDGVSFWSKLGVIAEKIDSLNRHDKYDLILPIVAVGSGGTAAAIAAWIAKRARGYPLYILGKSVTLYARTESYFQNMTFRNDDVWRTLSPDARRKFADRLVRGAVWSYVLDDLSKATGVEYIVGAAEAIFVENEGNPAKAVLKVKATQGNGERLTIPASIVIDATGFDGFWFTKLLPNKLAKRFRGFEKRKEDLPLDPSFAVKFHGVPPLCVPNLANSVSPTAMSLMALGEMSDRILRRYVIPT